MPITHDQALAFYAALLDSKPMRFHVEAVLGYGKSPGKVSDFDSHNSDTLDRCEELLEHVTECTGLLKLQLRDRPRQQELDFSPGDEPASSFLKMPGAKPKAGAKPKNRVSKKRGKKS